MRISKNFSNLLGYCLFDSGAFKAKKKFRTGSTLTSSTFVEICINNISSWANIKRQICLGLRGIWTHDQLLRRQPFYPNWTMSPHIGILLLWIINFSIICYCISFLLSQHFLQSWPEIFQCGFGLYLKNFKLVPQIEQ